MNSVLLEDEKGSCMLKSCDAGSHHQRSEGQMCVVVPQDRMSRTHFQAVNTGRDQYINILQSSDPRPPGKLLSDTFYSQANKYQRNVPVFCDVSSFYCIEWTVHY